MPRDLPIAARAPLVLALARPGLGEQPFPCKRRAAAPSPEAKGRPGSRWSLPERPEGFGLAKPLHAPSR